MRDHRSLKAFILADELLLRVYENTTRLPKEETYGLGAQLRKTALSVPSNIVEGCARASEAELRNFMNIAFGSARELEYQLSVARRLGHPFDADIEGAAAEVCKVLRGFLHSI